MEGKLMNKKYIVENLEFDPKFKTEKEIEDLKFQTSIMQYGVWDAEGRTEDERINNLFGTRCRITWEFIFALLSTVTTDLML